MYQKAKELVVDIFHLWSKHFSNRQVEPIFKQLIRSAGSIGANVGEGYGRNNRKEFRQFLGVARGSGFETSYWLEILREIIPDKTQIDKQTQLNLEITKMLSSSIKTLGSTL